LTRKEKIVFRAIAAVWHVEGVFGFKREKAQGWRKIVTRRSMTWRLSPSIIRMMGRAVARMGR
jgi:hypothetical protein